MSKRKWGAIRTFPNRDGCYFVKKDGGHTHTRLVSDDPDDADEIRLRIWAKWKEGHAIPDAIALVMGDPPEAEHGTSDRSFFQLGRLFLADKERAGRRKPRGLQTSRERIEAMSQEAWALKDIASLSFEDLDAWIARRRRQGRADATIQNDLSAASAVLRHAKKRRYVERETQNIFSDCRLEAVAHRDRPALDVYRCRHFLEIACDVADDHAYHFMLAGVLTGWRLQDLASLPVPNVELSYQVRGEPAPRLVAVRATEKKRRHKVAFLAPSPLLQWLRQRLARGIGAALAFTNRAGTKWNSQTINHQIRKVLLACDQGIIPRWMIDGNDAYTPFTFHGFRHTADSIMKHLGVGDHIIDAQLGWQTGARSTMHRHYATAFEEDMYAAALKVTEALLDSAGQARKAAM
ncbi:MAG: tyrosine-type recombinase/integrase [Planctomycetota bacterium]|jgi:integrase